jgi:ribonucleotide monophosphatase NagD (HAD superfamily)
MFDIDGVIVRGKEVLPAAVESFKKLVDSNGKFRVPVIFVTNAGNNLRCQTAQKLTDLLGVKVTSKTND